MRTTLQYLMQCETGWRVVITHIHANEKTTALFIRMLVTWFFACLVVSQLSQVIAATRIHSSVSKQKNSVSPSTAYTAHHLPIKEFTFAGLYYDLFVNSTQTKLAIGGTSPTQHRNGGVFSFKKFESCNINIV